MKNKKGKVERKRKNENDVKGNSNGGLKILVQAVKRGPDGGYSIFYTFDLDKGVVVKCPHVLEKAGFLNFMVALGSRIYLIGCHEEGETLQGDGQQVKVHGGTSYLDLNNQDGWKAAPPLKALKSRSCIAHSVALCGKIFVFRGLIGEYFCPKLNEWFKLRPPPGADNFHLSEPFVTDSYKKRLLLHHKYLNTLFAYYPAKDRWEIVAKNFTLWTSRVVFYNGVLFFYHPDLDPWYFTEYNVIYAAYDVASKRWLKVHLSSSFHLIAMQYRFTAFLNFGNGIMCLATFAPSCPPLDHASLCTVLFKIDRDANQDVLVTPISSEHHCIEEDKVGFANYLAI